MSRVKPCDSSDRRALAANPVALSFVKILLAIPLIASATTFTVTSAGDADGTTCNPGASCTLRQALNAANLGSPPAQIVFAIPGAGVHIISPVSELPPILTDNTTIDGYTQPGASPNSLADGDNAVIRIRLDGVNRIPDGSVDAGLEICARSTIRGLSITRFSVGLFNNCTTGTGNSPEGSVVQGNFIGLAPDGSAAGNTHDGIVISPSMQIGGAMPADRNVISANGDPGLPDSSAGIALAPSPTGALIIGNYIGTGLSGISPAGNIGAGIKILAHDGVVVGDPSAPNRLAFNAAGIVVSSNTVDNRLFANDIFDNVGLGIDLCAASCESGNGVTPNDVNDIDVGGNHLQNFPVLSSAVLSYGSLHVPGSLDIPHDFIATKHDYTIALYANSTCDPSGHGQGRLFLGSDVVSLIDGGTKVGESFAANVSAAPLANAQITATATDPNGNTSEFSTCALLTLGDGIFTDGFGG